MSNSIETAIAIANAFLMSCVDSSIRPRVKVDVDSGSPVYGLWSQFALVWTNYHNLTWVDLFAWEQVVFMHKN